jgi:WD40 repeat protein
MYFREIFMKRAFLFLAVAILFCNTTLAQEPDPDPNLIWKTENYYNSFVIHPNGNIIASKGLAVTELNGNTGEVIREFPFYFEFYALSKDGKYLAGGIDGLVLIDYETGEVVKTLDVEGSSRVVFMSDNERLLIRTSYEESEKQFCLYNYITDEKSFFEVGSNIGIWSFTISPDGRFLAIGGFIFKQGEENKTILLLCDAVTWKPIKNLATFDEDNEVRSIKFSPDSRLVGFQVYLSDLYIYNIETLQLNKNYNTASGFGFITNEYVALGSGYAQPPVFNLTKLDNDQIIYTKINSAGISEHNRTNNTMIVNYGVIYCYDFNKIITGASIKPEIPNPFTVEYSNNGLSIRNYTFVTNSINCTITDVNGRIIRNINLNSSTNEMRIPIKLLSGTYFLHIKDGGKEYVDKFLVVE